MSIRITRVKIRNFRSIGPSGVDFRPRELCALIGENNAGKTNIVSAIQKVLGPIWPQIHNFTEDEFYRRERSNNPYICVEISSDTSTDTIEFGRRSGDDDFRLYFNGRFARREDRDRYPLVLVDVQRQVKDQMAYDRWTPLGRLLQDINRELRSDPGRANRFRSSMQEVKSILSESDDFERLEEIVRTETARILRRDPAEFRMDFNLYDPWNFYRTVQVIAADDDLEFQASQAGMGLQSALTVAVIQAYAQIRHADAILAIEEPEVYLHPQAQRNFFNILVTLAEGGTQVFYTTHSANFLRVDRFDDICLVRREGPRNQRQTTVRQLDPARLVADFNDRHPGRNASDVSVKEHLNKHCSTIHNEGFFASKVILVEGNAETESFPIYARALDFDLDAQGVSVIGCNGKTAMPDLARLFNEFRIPTYIVFDGDRGKPDAHPEINRELLGLAGDEQVDHPDTTVSRRHAVFQVDFETTLRAEVETYEELEQQANSDLGITPDRGKGIRAKYVAAALVKEGELEGDKTRYVPTRLRQIVDAIQELEWEASVLVNAHEATG